MKLSGLPRFATRRVANLHACRKSLGRLATHCVANLPAANQGRIFRVKLPDKLQIVYGVTGPEVRFKPSREILQQSRAIPGSLSSLLFLLDDLPPNEPVSHDLGCINRTSDAGARRFENPADAIVNRIGFTECHKLFARLAAEPINFSSSSKRPRTEACFIPHTFVGSCHMLLKYFQAERLRVSRRISAISPGRL